MKPQKNRYLDSWTNELHSRAARIRDLIGGAHWLSDGHHKEHLIREFLRRYLPSSCIVSRGFVVPAAQAEAASREIDVLIADPAAAAPWFNEGEILIAPPDSVVAHLHIKTTFSKKGLCDALLSAANVQAVCEEAESFERVWVGVFFFAPKTSASIEKQFEVIVNAAGTISNPRFLPDHIAILGGPLTIVDHAPNGNPNAVRLRCFECGEHAFALALADLFDRMAATKNSRPSDWNHLVHNTTSVPPLVREIHYENIP